MESKEKDFVNLTKEFIIHVSKHKKAWKKIDELYNKHYDKCMYLLDQLDEKMKELDLKLDKETFHPNRNTATISIEYNDLIKFVE